jgi:hypothetical protein
MKKRFSVAELQQVVTERPSTLPRAQNRQTHLARGGGLDGIYHESLDLGTVAQGLHHT